MIGIQATGERWEGLAPAPRACGPPWRPGLWWLPRTNLQFEVGHRRLRRQMYWTHGRHRHRSPEPAADSQHAVLTQPATELSRSPIRGWVHDVQGLSSKSDFQEPPPHPHHCSPKVRSSNLLSCEGPHCPGLAPGGPPWWACRPAGAHRYPGKPCISCGKSLSTRMPWSARMKRASIATLPFWTSAFLARLDLTHGRSK